MGSTKQSITVKWTQILTVSVVILTAAAGFAYDTITTDTAQDIKLEVVEKTLISFEKKISSVDKKQDEMKEMLIRIDQHLKDGGSRSRSRSRRDANDRNGD